MRMGYHHRTAVTTAALLLLLTGKPALSGTQVTFSTEEPGTGNESPKHTSSSHRPTPARTSRHLRNHVPPFTPGARPLRHRRLPAVPGEHLVWDSSLSARFMLEYRLQRQHLGIYDPYLQRQAARVIEFPGYSYSHTGAAGNGNMHVSGVSRTIRARGWSRLCLV